MKWIKLSTLKPEVVLHGEKILIFRIGDMYPSVFNTDKMHLCESYETWWMILPNNPKY